MISYWPSGENIQMLVPTSGWADSFVRPRERVLSQAIIFPSEEAETNAKPSWEKEQYTTLLNNDKFVTHSIEPSRYLRRVVCCERLETGFLDRVPDFDSWVTRSWHQSCLVRRESETLYHPFMSLYNSYNVVKIFATWNLWTIHTYLYTPTWWGPKHE